MRRPQSPARNSRWFSAHSTRPNFMSARAPDFTAMTHAASPSPKTRPIRQTSSPRRVRTKGAEVGLRTKFLPGLNSSLSLFMLDQASELVFSGDAGTTEPSRPSRRIGIEWTNEYRPVPWLAINADLAVTHARFVG